MKRKFTKRNKQRINKILKHPFIKAGFPLNLYMMDTYGKQSAAEWDYYHKYDKFRYTKQGRLVQLDIALRYFDLSEELKLKPYWSYSKKQIEEFFV